MLKRGLCLNIFDLHLLPEPDGEHVCVQTKLKQNSEPQAAMSLILLDSSFQELLCQLIKNSLYSRNVKYLKIMFLESKVISGRKLEQELIQNSNDVI